MDLQFERINLECSRDVLNKAEKKENNKIVRNFKVQLLFLD